MKLDLHHKLFFAFIGWMALGVIFSDYPFMALQGFYPYRGEGLITYLVLTCIGLSYWKAFDSIKPLAWICLSFCVVLVICDKLMIFSHFTRMHYDSLFVPDMARASFACTSGPLLMALNPFLAFAAFLEIMATGTRTALVGLSVGCVAFMFFSKRRNKPFLLLPVIIVLLSMLTLKFVHIEEKVARLPKLSSLGHGARSSWLLQGYRLSQGLPLTGFGVDTLSEYLVTPEIKGYEDLRRFTPDKTHFLPMDIVLQTGWIGYTLILLSLGYAVAIAIKFPNKENLACICAVLSFVVFGFLNPSGMVGESIVITALFGIRKTV